MSHTVLNCGRVGCRLLCITKVRAVQFLVDTADAVGPISNQRCVRWGFCGARINTHTHSHTLDTADNLNIVRLRNEPCATNYGQVQGRDQ